MGGSRAVCFLAALVSLSACARGKKSGEQPPAAVRKAANELVGSGAALHREGSIYEAAGSAHLEMELGADGAVRETEIAVPLAALPAPVRAAVEAKLPKGAVVRESEVILTPSGVRFEVEAKVSSGEPIELTLDPAGRAVSEGDEDGDDGEDADDDGH